MNNKYIHYCWFGKSPLPDRVKKCIKSWKNFLPEYKIIRWDENNYDISKCKYMETAYKMKKYGFVSDFARFDILYKYGGLYLDTDVEIIKPFDKIIKKGPFMGLEEGTIDDLILLSHKKNTAKPSYIAPGLCIYSKPKMRIIKEFMDIYQELNFVDKKGKMDLTASPSIITKYLLGKKIIKEGNNALVEGFTIYPTEYFNPMGDLKYLGTLNITNNTYSIHHYDASWKSKKEIEWIRKMKQKKEHMDDTKFNKYLRRIDTRIKKSIYINGFFGFIKNQIKKAWK